jgi:tetratricopeptide (TPR) repeat protein
MFKLFLCFFLFIPSLAMGATPTLDRKAGHQYKAMGYEAQVKGDLSQAQFLYERAEVLLPDDAGLLNDIGLVKEALGKVDAAETYYLKAISADFKCLPAYSNLGYLYENKKNYELAADYFEKRVKFGNVKDPRTLKAQSDLDRMTKSSRSLMRKKKAADKESLENAMILRSKEKVVPSTREAVVNAEVDYERGVMLFKARHYDAARRSFEMCLAIANDHKGAAHMLERTKAIQKVRPVVKYVRSEVEQDRAIAMAEYDKGLRLLRDGYRDEALKAFDRALLFLPSDKDIEAARQKALEK